MDNMDDKRAVRGIIGVTLRDQFVSVVCLYVCLNKVRIVGKKARPFHLKIRAEI